MCAVDAHVFARGRVEAQRHVHGAAPLRHLQGELDQTATSARVPRAYVALYDRAHVGWQRRQRARALLEQSDDVDHESLQQQTFFFAQL